MYKVIAICGSKILVLNIFSDKRLALDFAEKIKEKYKACKIRIVSGDESLKDLVIP